jgi:hypothetical protein
MLAGRRWCDAGGNRAGITGGEQTGGDRAVLFGNPPELVNFAGGYRREAASFDYGATIGGADRDDGTSVGGGGQGAEPGQADAGSQQDALKALAIGEALAQDGHPDAGVANVGTEVRDLRFERGDLGADGGVLLIKLTIQAAGINGDYDRGGGSEAGRDTPSSGAAVGWALRGRTVSRSGRRRRRGDVRGGKLTFGGEAGFEPGPDTFVDGGWLVGHRNGGGGVAIGLQLGGAFGAGAQMIIEDNRLVGPELVERGEWQQLLYFFVIHR